MKHYDGRRAKRKEGKNDMIAKKCPYCGNRMKYRGPKDTLGTMFWKCRNKQCGRTVSVRKDPPKTVVPLCYIKSI